MSKLRIISDGTPGSTHILDASGDKLKLGPGVGITKIVIDPIVAGGGLVTAHVTIEGVALDIDGEADAWPGGG
jgi:hypothetical protein